MNNRKQVNLTQEQCEMLDEVKEMLKEKYGTASYGDAIIHLHRFWKQNKGKEDRGPDSE